MSWDFIIERLMFGFAYATLFFVMYFIGIGIGKLLKHLKEKEFDLTLFIVDVYKKYFLKKEEEEND